MPRNDQALIAAGIAGATAPGRPNRKLQYTQRARRRAYSKEMRQAVAELGTKPDEFLSEEQQLQLAKVARSLQVKWGL